MQEQQQNQQNTGSNRLSDLIDCDGFERAFLDYQRQMKFKKGSPKLHLRIFRCPFSPKLILWAIKYWTSLDASMIQKNNEIKCTSKIFTCKLQVKKKKENDNDKSVEFFFRKKEILN